MRSFARDDGPMPRLGHQIPNFTYPGVGQTGLFDAVTCSLPGTGYVPERVEQLGKVASKVLGR